MIRQIVGRLTTASKAAAHARYDALDLLRSDHMKIEAAAIHLRIVRDGERRRKIFKQMRAALEDHMRLEETIFYPACAKIRQLSGLIDHAHTEHQLVKNALKDLAIIEPTSRRFDSLLTKAILSVEHHVYEEENRIFGGVRKHMSRAEFRVLSDQLVAAHGGAPAQRRAA